MDITDGETTGGDGLPGPASRKLQGTNAEKRKSGKRKTRDADGVEVQVQPVTPETYAVVKAALAGASLPVTGKPWAKSKKSLAARILVMVSLSASVALGNGPGHPSSHNTDGSHKTVQVQTGGRREENGSNVLPDGASTGTSNIQHLTPNIQAEAEGGAGEKRKAESENRETKNEVGRQVHPDQHQAKILQELQFHGELLDRLVRGQQSMMEQLPLIGLGQGVPVSEDEAHRLFALLRALESESNFRKAPVTRVFMLYCLDGMSRDDVARDCNCSPALITLRLQAIQKKLGRKPSELRQYSDHFERIADSLTDSRARRIDRRRAIDGDDPED